VIAVKIAVKVDILKAFIYATFTHVIFSGFNGARTTAPALIIDPLADGHI